MMQPILDQFQPGRTLYLPGASGECIALTDALAQEPERMKGVHVVSCLLPGFNAFDYAALDPGGRVTSFLLPPALRCSFEQDKVRLLPLSYSNIAAYLGTRLQIDVAIAHVAPPGENGLCSLGVAADFTPIAWSRAKIRAFIINHAMPDIKGGPCISIGTADYVAHIDSPIINGAASKIDTTSDLIGARVASLVPDGAAIQIGVGGVPGGVWPHLVQHRNLVIASGLIGDAIMLLAESGALRSGGDHRAGVALGNLAFYKFLTEQDFLVFATVPETHGTDSIAKREKFTAINSALEVDLFGQANLEWQSGRVVSGVGGAPDFARGAIASKGGRSIVALPATAKNGLISRIVPRLIAPAVSLCRSDIDTIVTEHGIAELRDRSLDERAKALIEIAAPEWREKLSAEWQALRKSF